LGGGDNARPRRADRADLGGPEHELRGRAWAVGALTLSLPRGPVWYYSISDSLHVLVCTVYRAGAQNNGFKAHGWRRAVRDPEAVGGPGPGPRHARCEHPARAPRQRARCGSPSLSGPKICIVEILYREYFLGRKNSSWGFPVMRRRAVAAAASVLGLPVLVLPRSQTCGRGTASAPRARLLRPQDGRYATRFARRRYMEHHTI
jgi:hypothetical protein